MRICCPSRRNRRAGAADRLAGALAFGLAGVAAALLAASPLLAAEQGAPAPKHFTLVTAGEGVYAAIAKEGDPAAGGNAGFVVGTDSVLVVDAFQTPAAAEELAAEIRRLTPLPVRWVVNTHYHLDHVGGDAVFTRGGAAVIAQENERGWVRTENLKWWKTISPENREMVEHLVLPDVTYRDGLTVWLGERRVDVHFRPGHTGGDSIVFVPSANVLFGGDLIWKNTLPNLIDASTEAWVNTLDGFLQDHPATTFVPGHGELAKALDVRLFRDYLAGLRFAVAKALANGRSGQELVALLLPAQHSRYGTWKLFDQFAERNIVLTEQEVKGTKKLPTPAP